jgi:hypothetical protein
LRELHKDAPDPRVAHEREIGEVIAFPEVGGSIIDTNAEPLDHTADGIFGRETATPAPDVVDVNIP